MRLVRLSGAAIGLCLAGVLLLGGLAVWSAERLAERRQEIDALVALKARIDALSVASDQLLLFRADPPLRAATFAEARAIRTELLRQAPEAPAAQRAARRIEELLATLTSVYAQAEGGSPAGDGAGPLPLPPRTRAIMHQVADHGLAIDVAVDDLFASRRAAAEAYTDRLLMLFLGASLLFGSACVLAFGVMYQRIAGPVRRLSATLQRLARGEGGARAQIGGRDEMAALGAALDGLLDQQARANQRIRDQRAALEEQARLLRIGGEVARFGGWSVDLVNGRCHWSDMVCEIHGRPHGYRPAVEEGIGYYVPEHQGRIRELFERCAGEGVPYDDELQIIDTAGTRRWVRTTGVPVRDGQGRIVSVQGAFQDITERVAMEAQLRQAQRLEAIGQLTGGIAHDFNNLLTVIIGNAEVLAESLPADSPGGELARMIQRGGQRGAELTHQLLAFARKQPLQPRVVDLNELLPGLRVMLSRTLPESIRLEVDPAAAPASCLVDPGQLENAVLNLAINARDAMPSGGLLAIETANVELDERHAASHGEVGPGAYVCLSVSDTGEGIAAEHLEHLFEPFYTTKATGKGTGLGLPMVYGFVRQSGGHVTVYSEPGLGTTIRLYLPQADADGRPAEVSAEAASPAPPRPARILVVEDDALVRAYATAQLRALGHEVLEAADAGAALAVLEGRSDIDLLFTDVVLPGPRNGAALAAEARRLRPGLRVLYCSGYPADAVVAGGSVDPDVDLLGKPYRRGELAARVQAALSRPR